MENSNSKFNVKGKLSYIGACLKWCAEKLLLPIVMIIVVTKIPDLLEPPTKTQIILGATHTSVLSPTGQKNRIINQIAEPANHLLGKTGKNYEFGVSIIGDEYSEIIKGLLHNRVDIAFVPPYEYIQNFLANVSALDSFQLIGFKYMNAGIWYYSGLLCPNEIENFEISSIDNVVDSLVQKGDTVIFILNSQSSTSTKIVPEIFLAQHMRNLDQPPKVKRVKFEYMIRSEMMNKISNNDRPHLKYFAFLSSDDWYDAQDSNLGTIPYTYKKIKSIRIPYDPALVKSEEWKERCVDKNIDQEILQALRSWVYTEFTDTNGKKKNLWIENNEGFIDFAFSGVITDTTHETLNIRFAQGGLHDTLIERLMRKQPLILAIGKFDKKKKIKNDFEWPDSLYSFNSCQSIKIEKIENKTAIKVKFIKPANWDTKHVVGMNVSFTNKEKTDSKTILCPSCFSNQVDLKK